MARRLQLKEQMKFEVQEIQDDEGKKFADLQRR